MTRSLRALISFLILIFLFTFPAFAESNYVLPYPSAMPGNVVYKINLVKERIMKYWYFGSFGQFDYNLKESDKYLVEAKILFEYKQYLLANIALHKSDQYFYNINICLTKAKEENKNIEQKQKILKEASLKHVEELNFIRSIVPSSFIWQPEKSASTDLNFDKEIDESIRIRKSYL